MAAHPSKKKKLEISGRSPNGDTLVWPLAHHIVLFEEQFGCVGQTSMSPIGSFSFALSAYRNVPWKAAFNSLPAEYVNPVALRLSATANMPVLCTSSELHVDTVLVASRL